MLTMLDGNGHADCESVGRGSNPQVSTNHGGECVDMGRTPNPATRRFDSCHLCQFSIKYKGLRGNSWPFFID